MECCKTGGNEGGVERPSSGVRFPFPALYVRAFFDRFPSLVADRCVAVMGKVFL